MSWKKKVSELKIGDTIYRICKSTTATIHGQEVKIPTFGDSEE